MSFAHTLTTSLPKLLQRADLCKLTFPLVPHTMPSLPAASLTAPTWEASHIEKVNLEEGIFFKCTKFLCCWYYQIIYNVSKLFTTALRSMV